jgi:hypothetical protein
MADVNPDELEVSESVTSALARNVQDKFEVSKSLRVLQEVVWKEALQNFNGTYGSDVTFREGASSVFVNLTQMKTMAAYSRLMAVMMPPAGYPWAIKPTPHPDLVKLGMKPEAALASPEMSPEFKQVLSQAKAACDGMQNRIKDNLVETRWEEKFSRGVLDLVTFGTMIFKGPLAAPAAPKKWVLVDQEESFADKLKGLIGIHQKQQKYELVSDSEDDSRADLEWVSPFEFYPDPAAYTVSDAMWAIHRHVFNKNQMVELAEGDFDAEEINLVLNEIQDGNWSAEPWESGVDIINRRSASMQMGKRYIVFEFWGYLSGRELKTAGHDVPDGDLNKMHLSNVWVCGNHCIKITVSNRANGKLPFFVVPYEKVPYKIWGRGVPEKMADPQAIINASARAMVENMGIACVTGDTVVYRHQRPSARKPRKYNARKQVEVTINELWAMKNKSRGGLRQNVIRSLDESTGQFFGNRIVDIYYNGDKQVYRVNTKNGYTIKATDTHLFMGEDGHWRELRDFFVGDGLVVNGTETIPQLVCIDCGKSISKPNARRCKSCAAHISSWNLKQAHDAISNNSVSESQARSRRLVREQMKSNCELCGIDKRLHIHHEDKNPYNSDPSNLKTLCYKCHAEWHHFHDSVGDPILHTYRDFDEIVSIEPLGIEPVYDLHMTAPNHNFVANGFVVHNCAPQVVVDVNRLVDGTKYDQIAPWGIWPVKNMEGASQEPVQFKVIPSIMGDLKLIQDIFRNFVQEVTSMPDMASGFAGNGQHNRTAGGMSMLFGAADSYTRGVVFNIDNDLTKPMIRALYDWEMQYNPDMTIKGDMQVDAGGVTGLMNKEMATQKIAEVFAALGQIPGSVDYINMAEVAKEIFRGLDIVNDNIVYSDEEVQKIRAQNQQQEAQKAAQIAQAQNVPKPKAETTPPDMMMQVLEKTIPTDPIYPIIFEKWLAMINQLDPQSLAALDMMKHKNVLENKAFADQQELAAMQQDIELASQINASNPQGGQAPQEPAPEPTPQEPPPAPPVIPNIHINMPNRAGKHKFTQQPDGTMLAESVE